MRKIKYFFFLCLGILILNRLEAVDQKPLKLAVIDIEKILHESKAAQFIQKMVEEKRNLLQKDVEKYEKELRTEEALLKQLLQTQQDRSVSEKKSQLDAKVDGIQKRISSRSKILEEAFNNARGELIQTLMRLVAELAQEKDLTLILPKNLVIFGADDYEVTDQVLQRLNTQLPYIDIKIPKGL